MTRSAVVTALSCACGICGGVVPAGLQLTCVGCGADYHRACRLAVGRCTSRGCRRAAAPAAPAASGPLPRFAAAASWGLVLAAALSLATPLAPPALAGAWVVFTGVIAAAEAPHGVLEGERRVVTPVG
ncbi:MAG: hypothetical protein M9894_36715 [Planctomycetes bacterium]|nr:hypothetical protein [Planctomycetota bacterium]